MAKKDDRMSDEQFAREVAARIGAAVGVVVRETLIILHNEGFYHRVPDFLKHTKVKSRRRLKDAQNI